MDVDDEKTFIIGLKIFSEVVLNNKGNDILKQLKTPISEIMKILKSNIYFEK